MARPKPKAGEFGLIARYFAPLAKDQGAFGLLDDAAILPARADYDLVVTKDAIVEGVHFLPDDPRDTVAQKLLRVNISDLAAKGAVPAGYLLMTAFQKGAPESQVAAFAKGLARDQAYYNLSLWGGDTVATPGPATFSCTMMGWVKRGRMIRRAGARPGDDIWVTGAIGDSGEGLTLLRARPPLRGAAQRALAQAYRIPSPPATFGATLARVATAAMDVSDGLVQDAGHLALASGVALELNLEAIPLSPAFLAVAGDSQASRMRAIAAGDDYQTLFTAGPKHARAILAAANQTQTRLTRIGVVRAGQGVTVMDEDRRPVAVKRGGYTHF